MDYSNFTTSSFYLFSFRGGELKFFSDEKSTPSPFGLSFQVKVMVEVHEQRDAQTPIPASSHTTSVPASVLTHRRNHDTSARASWPSSHSPVSSNVNSTSFQPDEEESFTKTKMNRCTQRADLDTSSTSTPGAGAGFECNVCFDNPRDPVVTQCGHLYCWPCIYKWIQVHPGSSISSVPNTGMASCPVCKSAISQSNLIPIYGRGNNDTSRVSNPSGTEGGQNYNYENNLGNLHHSRNNLPPRPQGHRTEPPPPTPPHHHPGTNGAGEGFGIAAAAAAAAQGSGLFADYYGSDPPFGGRWTVPGGYPFSFTTFGIGMFPSLFGFQIGGGDSGQQGVRNPHTRAPGVNDLNRSGIHAHGIHDRDAFYDVTPEQETREFMSKMFLMVALFLVFCLLFF